MSYTHWSRRTSKRTDLEFVNYGAYVAVYPKTDSARAWLAENIHVEAEQRFGESVCIDRHALDSVVSIARAAGLICNPAKYRGYEEMEL